MELTNEQIELLQIIHDSENHGINKQAIAKLKTKFLKSEDDLQLFIENDLVEYVPKEENYYLAYEGFEKLENKVKPVRQKTDIEQYQEIVASLGGPKKLQRAIVFNLVIIAIFGATILYINPDFTKNNRQQFNIDQSTLHEIESLIQEKLDSIENSEKME